MKILTLQSPTMHSFEYDAATQHLLLKWRNGSTIKHKNVPKKLLNGLIQAASRGLFYQAYIKGQYPTLY